MTKVLMIPQPQSFTENNESGIRRVVDAYYRYLPEFGIELYEGKPRDEGYDLLAIHAGTYINFPKNKPMVAHLHGLYWTADYLAAAWEWRANSNVIYTARAAREITVPSEWVAETIRRDMRVDPHVVPHGIDWNDWQHDYDSAGYVLWNKNRSGVDVCNPDAIGKLAQRFTSTRFVTTFAPRYSPGLPNVAVTGLKKYEAMKIMVQRAGIYLSTVKETFGIGTLEALASGVPVLGYAYGGNLELVQHGVNGYLAAPNDDEDLARGLEYCMKNRAILSDNARETAKAFTWQAAVEKVADIYRKASGTQYATVSVIIPSYNYADKVGRAIDSAVAQSFKPKNIIVVDDGSTDNTREVIAGVIQKHKDAGINIEYIYQNNSGVAVARNNGIAHADTKYVCCLDADDRIANQFLEACVTGLERDNTLGIAYTGLHYVTEKGEGLSKWPGDFDYNQQLQRRNQIPTCCVFRKEMWERLGGYKQRYAPQGAGAEDAEFWLRAGAYGYDAKKVTDAGLFVYSWQTGRVSGDKNYREVDWLQWHPWTKDEQHPFASVATPKRASHPVRQYDEPVISVVIPVSDSHTKEVINALDSLEAQTFRKWEAIIAWDCDPNSEIEKVYPYIREVRVQKAGAGAARNSGAKIARAPLLLFLDADDWLYPEALEKMLSEWEDENKIVYSDYVGKAFMNEESAKKLGERLLYYDQKNQEAVVMHYGAVFDCNRACNQPQPERMYIWNLITSLVPKIWHDEIGGFDERMPSWEDWDYWIRMAKAGKCFSKIDEPLVVYKFYSGTRRERGLQEYPNLIKYMQAKYAEGKDMARPCGSCPGGQKKTIVPAGYNPLTASARQERASQMSDKDMILAQYDHPNRGQHKVVGGTLFSQRLPGVNMVRVQGGYKINYGHRGGGERFYVHAQDIAAQPHIFHIVEERKPVVVERPVISEPEPPQLLIKDYDEPESVIEGGYSSQIDVTETINAGDVDLSMLTMPTFDVTLIPGVTPSITKQLEDLGVSSYEELLKMGISGLTAIKGIGETRARAILKFAEDNTKTL